ncbi:hypothetical protein L1987_44788 [Smallanthus sonchifolius]|uniref:Uncharacterized protein n=1 Tax=Smallanthus sonchifolius TaxID=185202 RepID=A0ACB9GPU1_9ASTR|nr:hypothetical protein L1987_44788 [Smallanthus sonchifolius]
MDVDPCVVATRKEIVAQSFDLTASEHSGVNFSQATTSNYPTSSADVPPQTVKDVVVTKTESENNTQKLKDSSTINQETSSPVVANDTSDQESEKKKKKKKQDLDITQKLLVSTVIKQVTPSSVAYDSLDQEPEIKNQDLLQTEAADEALFVCNIPEPGQDYQKIATVEVDESLFKNRVPNPTSVSRTPVQASNGGTKNRPTKPIVQQPMWCDVCKVSCSNAYDTHASGKKHLKNLNKLERISNLTSTIIHSVTAPLVEKQVVNRNDGGIYVSCELCRVCCTSRDMLNEHVSGKKHQKNLKKSEKQRPPVACSPEPMNEEGEIVFSETSKRKSNESLTSEDTKRQKAEEEGRGVLVTCKLCNVDCNSLMEFKTHLAGFEHSVKALKQGKGGSNGLQVGKFT